MTFVKLPLVKIMERARFLVGGLGLNVPVAMSTKEKHAKVRNERALMTYQPHVTLSQPFR